MRRVGKYIWLSFDENNQYRYTMAEKFVGLNYNITYVDCERVHNLLKNNPDIYSKIEYLGAYLNRMKDRINKLEKILLKKIIFDKFSMSHNINFTTWI